MGFQMVRIFLPRLTTSGQNQTLNSLMSIILKPVQDREMSAVVYLWGAIEPCPLWPKNSFFDIVKKLENLVGPLFV